MGRGSQTVPGESQTCDLRSGLEKPVWHNLSHSQAIMFDPAALDRDALARERTRLFNEDPFPESHSPGTWV